MGSVIAGLIARYGCPVRLYNSETSEEVVGMLQPLRHRGHGEARHGWSALGGQPSGSHLLYCSVSPEGYDMVECGGMHYWLRRWEAFSVGGQVLYYWAMLTKEGADGTDL